MIKLKTRIGTITMSDEHPLAQKIKEGYDYEIDNSGDIIVKDTKSLSNKYQIIDALKRADKLEDIKELLIKFLELE